MKKPICRIKLWKVGVWILSKYFHVVAIDYGEFGDVVTIMFSRDDVTLKNSALDILADGDIKHAN